MTVLQDVNPRVPGIAFRVAHLTQPVLIATNRTRRPLTIFGRNGEPFLRLADDRIESNANSPLTYSTRSPSGFHGVTPPGIDLDAPPVWNVVGRGRSWSWFDPRIRRESSGSRTWTVVAGWGARKIVIEGGFESFDTHGHFDTRIEAAPAIEDLEIQLNDGLVPALYVRNETARVLHVRGRSDEAFLRIGSKGVFGNLESPDYYLGGVQTIRPVPRGVDPADPPRWRKLSAVPIWSWLEFRARLPESAHLRSTLGDTRHPVLEWSTPMTLGREPLTFRGVVQWIPPVATQHPKAHAPGISRWLLLSGVAGAFLVLLLFTRLRERARGRGAGSLDGR